LAINQNQLKIIADFSSIKNKAPEIQKIEKLLREQSQKLEALGEAIR
jgi:hypothetical protein